MDHFRKHPRRYIAWMSPSNNDTLFGCHPATTTHSCRNTCRTTNPGAKLISVRKSWFSKTESPAASYNECCHGYCLHPVIRCNQQLQALTTNKNGSTIRQNGLCATERCVWDVKRLKSVGDCIIDGCYFGVCPIPSLRQMQW